VSGGGRWNDSKDGTESASSSSSQAASSWNIDVFVDVVKELVCNCLIDCEPLFLICSRMY